MHALKACQVHAYIRKDTIRSNIAPISVSLKRRRPNIINESLRIPIRFKHIFSMLQLLAPR